MKTLGEKEELLRELGIFELRGLARELGVSSPTTKKREELIKTILKALENASNFEKGKSKKGRPYKEISSINQILNSMTNEIVPTTNLAYCDLIPFLQENQKFENNKNFDAPETECVGYVRKGEHNISFLDTKTNLWVFIPFNIKGNELLDLGDKVVVKAKKLDDVAQFCATKIEKINGIDIEKYNKIDEKEEIEIISNESIPFGNKNIKIGRRNSVCLQEDLYENKDFDNILKNCKNQNIKLSILGINSSFEDYIFFKNIPNIENFTTQYGTEQEINFNKILDAINYTRKMLSRNENSIFIITDIMEVVRDIEKCISNKEEYDEKVLMVMLREIFSLAKALDNGGYTSLVVCYREADKNNEFLQNEILRICKEIK